MNKHSECNTREHILATGEQLCMHRGFTGMGLSELLKTAEVPKGSFYHYFRSKEAFGVALLDHHYAGYLQRLVDHFDHGEGNYRDRLGLLSAYADAVLPAGHHQRLSDGEAVGRGLRSVGRYAHRDG